jgi:metallo-beta-lactamase family protein
MKIHFLGAAGTVTGSRFVVDWRGTRVLIDCGLFQGLKALRERNWQPLGVAADSLDAVVLTHAHLDHTGYLPALIDQGLSAPIYATFATRSLAQILLPDSGHLQEEEARYRNKSKTTRHAPARPLYTREQAVRAAAKIEGVGWSDIVEVGALHVRFHRAGHILGAAWVELTDGERTVVFSGDLGRRGDVLMNEPEPLTRADVLVMETTYGDREHVRGDPEAELAEVVCRTAERGGHVMIPAFSVGRAQAIMLILSRLKAEARIPDCPVYLNSPMAISASDIYCEHHEDHRLSREQCRSMCDVAKYVRDVEESKKLNQLHLPSVLIAGSGMVTGGRILHHLKAYMGDPRNTIVLAGFQAAGTRGEALKNGVRQLKIHGRRRDVRAEVATLDLLSAHADASELLQWAGGAHDPPQRVFLVHGEPSRSDAFRVQLKDELGWSSTLPALGEAHEVWEA